MQPSGRLTCAVQPRGLKGCCSLSQLIQTKLRRSHKEECWWCCSWRGSSTLRFLRLGVCSLCVFTGVSWYESPALQWSQGAALTGWSLWLGRLLISSPDQPWFSLCLCDVSLCRADKNQIKKGNFLADGITFTEFCSIPVTFAQHIPHLAVSHIPAAFQTSDS